MARFPLSLAVRITTLNRCCGKSCCRTNKGNAVNNRMMIYWRTRGTMFIGRRRRRIRIEARTWTIYFSLKMASIIWPAMRCTRCSHGWTRRWLPLFIRITGVKLSGRTRKSVKNLSFYLRQGQGSSNARNFYETKQTTLGILKFWLMFSSWRKLYDRQCSSQLIHTDKESWK